MLARAIAGWGVLLLLGTGMATPGAAADTVRVFAAASLAAPLERILDGIEGAVGIYASSGTLARQIEAGAPADIYISAHASWSDYLIAQGTVNKDRVAPFLRNRLVLVGQSADTTTFDADLVQKLSDDRIAIGDPGHVPAGHYAKQALQAIGVWDVLRLEAVRASSVRATLAFVEQEAVRYAIVYASDAHQSQAVSIVAPIPPDTHDPIVYTLTRLTDTPATQEVVAALRSLDILAKFEAAGFLPVEQAE